MKLEVLVSLLVFAGVFRRRQTITVSTVFPLLILSILNFNIILAIGFEKLLGSGFNPFLLFF
jgi:hypothetical protein